uniref:Nucleoporin Nup54 alpha-helical domain-containing protein n=1 Tax=Dunaliella tertiolecta TaxID=3047 RepID=A0A7S3R929_DUNTE
MAKRLAMAAMNEEEAAAAAEAVDTRLRRWRRLECDRLVLVAYVIRRRYPEALALAASDEQLQQQQQQQQQSLLGAPQGLPPQSTDAAVREVLELKAAYTPSSPNYKFKYLFLNVVDNPAQRVKPSGVDEMRWRQAMAAAGGPDNPDRLWPVLAVGFKDLLARSAAQSAALEENSQRLKSLNDIAHNLARKHATELKQRSNDVQKRHIELSHRLLHSFRNLDALESRLAASIGYRGDVARARELSMSKGLAAAEAEVSPVSSTSLPRRLEGMAAAVRTRAGAAGAAGSSAGQGRLDERSAAQLMVVLRDHAMAVSKLQNVLKQDALDVAIMTKERQAGVRMLE